MIKQTINFNQIASFYSKYNLYLQKKKTNFNFPYSHQILTLVKLLTTVGIFSSFLVQRKKKKILFISIYLKPETNFKWILYSKVQRTKSLCYNELKKIILHPSNFSSIIILNTNCGLLTGQQALKYRTGGIIHSIIKY